MLSLVRSHQGHQPLKLSHFLIFIILMTILHWPMLLIYLQNTWWLILTLNILRYLNILEYLEMQTILDKFRL